MLDIDIQLALLKLGYDLGPAGADGKIGPRSKTAIKAFQNKEGLVVDGIAGPHTQTALWQATTPVRPGRPEPDKSAMAGAVRGTIFSDDIAKPPPNASQLLLLDTARFIDEIIFHCAATPEGQFFDVDDVRAWHKVRGFIDVGYHYIVYLDGRIILGRPIGQIGAHVEGHNTGTISTCYIGGLAADGKTAKDTRTPAQRSSLLWLGQQLIAKHRGIRRVSGHNQYAAKACPSFDVRKDRLGALLAA